MDVEKCVFVLAIDYGVVVSGVRKKFGSDITEAKCRSFFDKIIQLPFRMPVESYDLEKLLETHLGDYLNPEHLSVLSSMISCILGANPRTFTRLANSFFLIYSVQTNSGEKHPSHEFEKQQNALILSSLCMQMGIPHIYSAILRLDDATELSELIQKGAELDLSSDSEVQDFLKGYDISSDLPQEELERLPGAMVKLIKVIQTVLSGAESDRYETFRSILLLSSITVVDNKPTVRQPSTKIAYLKLGDNTYPDPSNNENDDTSSVITATTAFEKTFSYALNKLFDGDPDLFSLYIEQHSSLLSETEPKAQSYFRKTKEILVGGKTLYLGVSTSTAQKAQQARELCSSCGILKGEIQWLVEDGSVYFSS